MGLSKLTDNRRIKIIAVNFKDDGGIIPLFTNVEELILSESLVKLNFSKMQKMRVLDLDLDLPFDDDLDAPISFHNHSELQIDQWNFSND